MPNPIAYLVLFSWPIVAYVMFKRMPLERAFVWTMIGGYLLLPPATSVDLPLLPPIDKLVMVNLSAFFLAIFVGKAKIALVPRSWAVRILLFVFIFNTIPTVLTNADPIIIRAPYIEVGPTDPKIRFIPGLVPREIISFSGQQILLSVLPFLAGRSILASATGRRELLRAMMIGALIYSIPSVIEIRFSPQFNTWIYGFFQHDFVQTIRGSTYRPTMFLEHPLWLAFFYVNVAIGLASLTMVQPKETRGKYVLALLWLMLVVIASRSLASTGYLLLLVPFIFLSSEAMRMRVAMIMVIVALGYPAMRNAGVIPLDDLVASAAKISEERAASLEYRFDNEELLLEHANDRRLFGWGGWGRSMLYSAFDASEESVADGRWIIVFGVSGVVGFAAEFGLLAISVLLIWLRRKRPPPDDDMVHTGTFALLIGLTMFDMLINATLVPYTWVIAGSLVGTAEKSAAAWRQKRAAAPIAAATASAAKLDEVENRGPRTVI